MATKSMTFKLFGKDVSASKTFKQVGKTAAGTATGIGAAFAASKLVDFTKQSIGALDSLGKQTLTLQRYMGGSTEDASRLAHAFTMTGTDTKLASVGLGIFSKNLVAAKDQQRKFTADRAEAAAQGKAFTGDLGKNAQAFADMGITIRDSNGDMLPMQDLLAATAEKFSKMPAGAQRTSAAMKLFGKSGASLLPFLSKGAAGVKELMEESDRLGTTLSGKDTDAVKKNTAEKRRMGEAIKGIQVTIGRHLMPAITGLVTFMSEKVVPIVAKVVGWLKEHKDIVVVLAGVLVPIIAGFKAWTVVMGIFNAVMAVNPIVLIILAIVGLIALVVLAYKKFDWFRKFIDGAWQGIQKAIQAVVEWFKSTAWPILKRIIGFVVEYYKFLWRIVSAVFRGIWAVVSKFIGFFRDRVWPVIRWVIDKVAIYYRWLWSVISAVFRMSWQVIQGFIGFFRDRVWPVIRWVIDKVATYYRWLWSVISAVFRMSWQVIQGFIGFFRDKVWPVIRWVIDKVKLGFQAMWSTVRGVWNAVWSKVVWVRDKLQTAADAIKGFFSGIWDGIKGAAESAFNWIRDLWNRILGGKGFHVPGTDVDFRIPMLAAGGIVTRPTLALIGEAGPEAVIPLRRGGIGSVGDGGPVTPQRRDVGAVRGGDLGFQAMWTTVRGVWNAVWSKVAWARDKLQTAADAIRGFFTGIWDGIKGAAESAFNWIRDLWNRILGGKGFHVPGTDVDFRIPMLAAGGIVTRPTLALIGEAGPEAVIPLRRGGIGSVGDAGPVTPQRRDVGAVRGGDVHIHVNGTIFGSKEQVARTVVDALNDAQNRGLRLNIRAS